MKDLYRPLFRLCWTGLSLLLRATNKFVYYAVLPYRYLVPTIYGTLTRWFLTQSTILNLALYLYTTLCTFARAPPLCRSHCSAPRPNRGVHLSTHCTPFTFLFFIFQDTSLPDPPIYFANSLDTHPHFLNTVTETTHFAPIDRGFWQGQLLKELS